MRRRIATDTALVVVFLALASAQCHRMTLEPSPEVHQQAWTLYFSTFDAQKDIRLFSYQPGQDSRPVEVLHAPSYVGVHGRHGQRLIVSWDDQVRLVNLPSGNISTVRPGRSSDFLGLQGSRLFLQDDGRSPTGLRKDSASLSCRLYAMDLDKMDEPALAWDQAYDHVLDSVETPDHFWVLADQGRAVWKIAKDGRNHRQVIQLDPDGPGRIFWARLSPDQQHLAASLWSEKPGNRQGVRLGIFSIARGDLLFAINSIPIEVDSISSHSSHLAFEWLDEHRIRFSETVITRTVPESPFREGYFQWFDVDIRTQKRLRTEPYTDHLGLSHQVLTPKEQARKQPNGRWRDGDFEQKGYDLFFAGAAHPLRPAYEASGGLALSEVAFSADGRWAAFYDRNANSLLLADGRHRRITKLHEGFTLHHRWLPR